MSWKIVDSEEDLESIVANSFQRGQVIFKHSTRCSISKTVLNRIEKAGFPEEMDFYFLDLLKYRPVSNRIAEKFAVHHESPQVLLIRNGECTFDESHMGITIQELIEENSKAINNN